MKYINNKKTMKKTVVFCSLALIFTALASTANKQTITHVEQADGFGSQFQTIIAAAVYADLHNMEYAYTPFSSMEHNYDNDPEFILKKEWLINFIGNVTLADQNSIPLKVELKNFFDTHIKACASSNALQKIRRIFRANKNKNDYFNSDQYNIAIHIRRPNAHDNRIEGTNTPNSLFLNIIQNLRKIYADKNIQFHIYSQGDTASFELFKNSDTTIHLNDSVEDSFSALVFADALVTSRSSYSYAAALLSEGSVYYIPFWHTPLPHWISALYLLEEKIS
ncbi:MAG: hypothetical protein M1114_05865 [Candidatus Dependentiae bacterium]|nr:hypothetical protein [Candidatus Dependentiae bacterium]